MRDGCKTVLVKQGISFRVVADNTAQIGAIIDTLGYEWVTAEIITGTLTDADATFTLLIEDGNNGALADAAPVDDEFMVSQTDGVAPEAAASFTFAADNNVRKIEVQSPKRYVRATITPAANAANAFFGLTWRLGAPQGATVTQTAT